jgi:hypothetical protein
MVMVGCSLYRGVEEEWEEGEGSDGRRELFAQEFATGVVAKRFVRSGILKRPCCQEN